MKRYVIFLPQFHEILENDQWWGTGFTEWTNVKNATTLYASHQQPKHPLNNNYYNLLEKGTVEWQTKLLKDYHINGMIYYHYYFNGKLLLEKPAENLLNWTEIQQNFFFCWANHSWIKTCNGSRNVLIEQEYGCKSDWEVHFQYLLPFFRDARYEKKNNKPLFMIFNSNFVEKEEMFLYFDERAKQEGFCGICLIESFFGCGREQFEREMSGITSFIYYRESDVSKFEYLNRRSIIIKLLDRVNNKLRQHGVVKKPVIINGEKLMRIKLQNLPKDKNVVNGIWFEWDNTPRHKQFGYVITPYPKEQFFTYMDLIKNEEYLFINAWNEWCEGMILEPTEENGYKYLEWIKEWAECNDE